MELSDQQRAAISEGIAGLDRTRLSFMIVTNDDQTVGDLFIVRDSNNDDVLCEIGTVHSVEDLNELTDAVADYLNTMYAKAGEG